MVALLLGVDVQPWGQLHDIEVLLARVTGSIHTALKLCLVNHLQQ